MLTDIKRLVKVDKPKPPKKSNSPIFPLFLAKFQFFPKSYPQALHKTRKMAMNYPAASGRGIN